MRKSATTHAYGVYPRRWGVACALRSWSCLLGYGTVGYSRVAKIVTSVTVLIVNALPYGWDGVLLEVEDPAAWFAYLHQAREAGELDCEEIVPAATTVLLRGVRRTQEPRRCGH